MRPPTSDGLTRRRFLRNTAASGLYLAAGAPLLSACGGDSVSSESGHVLWIAQSVSGIVRLPGVAGSPGEPVQSAEVTFEISNNAEFENPLWFNKGTQKSSSIGFYEFAFSGGGFYTILPPVNDPNLQYFVWMRITGRKADAGFARVTRKEVRTPSRTPPVNTAPYQIRQDLTLLGEG